MIDEGLSKMLGICVLGIVALGVLWSVLTSQIGHWLAFAGAIAVIIKATQFVSRK